MRLIAHRGFADRYPENTVGAVRRAADHADMVEVDVRRCETGELVVIHDATVERTTGSPGRVDSLSVAELAELEVLDSGEGVPTLARVLEALPPAVGVNLELKELGTAADALALAASFEGEVLVSAFRPAILEEARSAAPDVPRALLFERRPTKRLATARDLDCTAVHPHWRLPLRRRIVARAHDAGLSVNAWTVQSRPVGWALARRGVDGIIADHPDVLRTVRERLPVG